MIYHFKDIENGQIAVGYTVLDINDHEAEIGNDDAPALLLAEKHGGELLTKQGKAPKDPVKYRTEQVEAARLQAEKSDKSALTKAVESGELPTAEAPASTDPVARQQQEK